MAMHSFSSIPSHHLPTHIHIFTLQRACAPSSAHYPSLGRTGGPWTGSQAARGKRPCTPRRGVLSSRRSGSSSASSFASVQPSPAQPSPVKRTCWLISRIAMSLRSEVKRSKAASMALFSVLASTTRKFFCASGGWVTCCALRQSSTPLPPAAVQWAGRGLTPTPASSMPVTVSCVR